MFGGECSQEDSSCGINSLSGQTELLYFSILISVRSSPRSIFCRPGARRNGRHPLIARKQWPLQASKIEVGSHQMEVMYKVIHSRPKSSRRLGFGMQDGKISQVENKQMWKKCLASRSLSEMQP